jgi:uncharacterized protein (DUF302 family)/uncharacterized membrane protein YidH (DUF202 family)
MPPNNLSDYLAAERTFLAWIRTGLALAGFGFVIARFGLFLREMRLDERASGTGPVGSPGFGAALILAGSLALVWSAWSYRRLIRRLKRGESDPSHESFFAVAIAIILSAVGVVLAIHLLSVNAAAMQPTQEISMSSNNGIVTIPSHHSVEQTVQRLEEILTAKGVKLFTVIDHSREAEKAGFSMRPCKLLIFGNPKAGTPIMLASPLAALDLPLKVLVWEKTDGSVWLSYNDTAYLQHRHTLPDNLLVNIAVVDALAAKAAGEPNAK